MQNKQTILSSYLYRPLASTRFSDNNSVINNINPTATQQHTHLIPVPTNNHHKVLLAQGQKSSSIQSQAIIDVKKTPRVNRLNQLSSPTTAEVDSRNNIHTENNLPPQPSQETLSALLSYLHAVIAQHQHYPERALLMERTGKTTLAFLLFPNGRIANLKVIQSAGSKDLDEAALAAVTDASPFDGVNRYLAQPQVFQITLNFDL